MISHLVSSSQDIFNIEKKLWMTEGKQDTENCGAKKMGRENRDIFHFQGVVSGIFFPLVFLITGDPSRVLFFL